MFGLLTDREIIKLTKKCNLIEPFVSEKVQDAVKPSYGLEPHGYTFRLHPQVMLSPYGFITEQTKAVSRGFVHEPAITPKLIPLELKDCFELEPGYLIVCRSLEYFRLPEDMVGLLFGKSTYTRQGILYGMTIVDGGYEGCITFTLFNASYKPVVLYPNWGIGQIIFFKSKSKPSRSYVGRYQNSNSIVTPLAD